MELKEAFIDKIICHHFSLDPSKSLINNIQMNMGELDNDIIKDFFIKPFASQKSEFCFSHPVNLTYNVVYQSALGLLQNGDFVKCSQDIFRHLQSVSNLPTIKEGDIFVAKVDDILVDGSYYVGLGIFKIESKSEFIETFVDAKGNLRFCVKSGFSSNRIDKACLIVFSADRPCCYLIDRSKDTKFWRQDFLGVIPKVNSFTQSKSAIQVFHSFINERLPEVSDVTKAEQIRLINKCSEVLKDSTILSMTDMVQSVFEDSKVAEQFDEYRKAFEEKEHMKFQDTFEVDTKAISISKAARRIKLDDTAEIHLMKTGNFVERGYDEDRGMYYYKLFFSKEK